VSELNLIYESGTHRAESAGVPYVAPEFSGFGTTITRRAFRARFTTAEKVAIEMAALDDPAAPIEARSQAAMIRAYQKDVDSAEHIDLGDPATAEGVQLLEAAGLLAAGRAAEIIETPVTWDELPSSLQG
jgi:hypothetical protein